MKKLFTALLSLTLVLSLAACGSQKEDAPAEPPDAPAETTVELQAYYDGLLGWMKEEFGADHVPQTVELEGEILEAYYPGLAEIATVQQVIQTSAISSVGFEIALVETENEADAETVEALFQERIDYQIEEGAWYPATVEVWENAQIIRHGNYVALVAASLAQEHAVESFQALFN